MAGKTVLRRIGIVSLGKVYMVLGAILGLFEGVIFAAVGTLISSLGVGGTAGFAAGFGVLSIVILPIFFAIGGFIVGAIFALLYNLVAGWVGGIQFEVGEK